MNSMKNREKDLVYTMNSMKQREQLGIHNELNEIERNYQRLGIHNEFNEIERKAWYTQ